MLQEQKVSKERKAGLSIQRAKERGMSEKSVLVDFTSERLRANANFANSKCS